VLLWGNSPAHLCLGQSQSAARELVPQVTVPVVRRPLGGGTVWVDEGQQVYVFIVPLRHAPRRPAHWNTWALQPAINTFRAFGLDVGQRGEDLWLDGRKIAGSGSATMGSCAVFASSFLLHFPRERFAQCIAGSAEFQSLLGAGLAATLTSWVEHAALPAADVLQAVFRNAVARAFGWRLQPAMLSGEESAAIDEAFEDMQDDGYDCGRRACPDGIKLNAESHLVERNADGWHVRELVVRGSVVRRTVCRRDQTKDAI
jgi:lipoate-protein ligase A